MVEGCSARFVGAAPQAASRSAPKVGEEEHLVASSRSAPKAVAVRADSVMVPEARLAAYSAESAYHAAMPQLTLMMPAAAAKREAEELSAPATAIAAPSDLPAQAAEAGEVLLSSAEVPHRANAQAEWSLELEVDKRCRASARSHRGARPAR